MSGILVDIENACQAGNTPDEKAILCWITAALHSHRSHAELAIRIVDEHESASLNAQYRHKNSSTNVLSFPSGLPEDSKVPILGDLAICAAVVEREAREQHKSLEAHWAHMVVHGTLHLLGFDHIEDAEADIMEAKEIAILHKLGFANPYIDQSPETKEPYHHD